MLENMDTREHFGRKGASHWWPLLLMACLLAIFCGCEKVIIEESEDGKKTEQTSKNNRNDNGDGDDEDGDEDDWDDGDMPEDTTATYDRNSSYLEEDIVDGNDPGSSDRDKVWTVTEFVNGEMTKAGWVEGYIVAACANSALKEAYVDFEPPFKWSSAILLADDLNERDVHKMMSVQLKSGSAIRKALDPEFHPEIQGKRLRVYGYGTIYLGIMGMKDIGSNDFVLSK